MTKRRGRRRFLLESLETRQLLAATTPDNVELVASSDFYQNAPVWQRTLSTPAIVSALGSPAYDLRTDTPGDQTLRISPETTNLSGTYVTRQAERMTRLLIDPKAVYEVNQYFFEESTSVVLDAYDAAGTLLGRFQVGVEDNQVDNKSSGSGGWHRGYIGNPNMLGAMYLTLPAQSYVIELRSSYETTIGFVGDALDSGFQVVEWNEERSIVSSRTLDLVESDEPVIIQPSKTYTLDASVAYSGTTNGIQHSVGYTAYDADGLRIEPKHVERFGSAADTRLAIDLKPGDTSFEVLDASGWSNMAGPETRALAWYGYADSGGRVYADYSYTRNVASDAVLGLWQAGAINGNRITLREAWSGPRLSAGTAVRNAIDEPNAGLFTVIAEQQFAPINTQANVSGFRKNGFSDASAFPPGAVSFRPAARLNEALSVNGYTELSYRVATRPSGSVFTGPFTPTRSTQIDVMANDAASLEIGTVLATVTNPRYGTVQIIPFSAGARSQVLYTAPAYFVGTDRFSYTIQRPSGELITDWVTVNSLGGNLDANPTLRQAVLSNVAAAQTTIDTYGTVNFGVVSGAVLSSRADNLNNLSRWTRPTNLATTYSLTKGVQHGTLTLNADGTFTYQAEPGFVGTDTFEYAASNGVQTSTRLALIGVMATVEEADRGNVKAISLAIRLQSTSASRLFYPNNPAYFDATGAPLLSWRVHILPFLGYDALYNRFRLDQPWDSPNNLPLVNQMPDIYRSAGDSTLSSTTRFHAIKAAPGATTLHFLNSNGSPRAGLTGVIHGDENALLVLRAGTDTAVPWSKPDDLTFNNANPLATLGNTPEPTIPVAFTDTTAALMPKDILAQTLTSIATIAESPGVTGVDARTLMRAWSERLNSLAVHANEYYKSQPARLREVGQSLYDYYSTYRVLPLWGSTDASGNRLLSWRVMLLPFMGQQELYSKFRLNEPWDSPNNIALLNSMPDVYRSAGDLSTTNTTRLRVLNGPGTLYSSSVTRPNYSIVSDDTSKTLFAVEAGVDKAVPWTMPDTLPLGADFLSSLGQLTENFFRAIAVDSSVYSIPTSTANTVLQALATIRAGEVEGRFPAANEPMRMSNNVRWIASAMYDFQQAHRFLPTNLWGGYPIDRKTPVPTLSWRVAILPFIGESTLFNAFRLNEPWDSPYNLSLLKYMPDVYRSNGMPLDSTSTRMQVFSGSRTILRPDGIRLRLSDVVDGATNTLFVVEASGEKAVPWTKPSDLDGDAIDLWRVLGNVGQSFLSALVDGSYRVINKSTNRYLNALVLRNDGASPPALEATQRIVIREGELAAIDLPIDTYTFDSPSVVQIATAPLTPVDENIWKGTRATLLAIDNNTIDGVRVTHLTVNGRVIEIVVIDDDGLSLTASPTSISEGGGIVQLTVTRPAIDLQLPLVVQIETSDRTRLNVPASVTIPAGQTSLTFNAIAIDNFSPGDSDYVRVTATAAGLGSSSVSIRIIDDESLLISFSPTSISEQGGVTTGTISRLGGLNTPLVVTLTNDRPDRAAMPAQLIIPAGQASITFQAFAIDNQFYNLDTTVHVTVSAQDYADKVGSFVITDFEEISLALSQEKISEADDVMTITVTRLSDSLGRPVTINLQTDRPDKVDIPSSVTIPGNQQKAVVQLRTIDNRLLDGLTHVYITAVYGGASQSYAAGTALVDVIDHEALSLTMVPPVLSENNGKSRGRLTRDNTDMELPLTVELVTSHPDLVNVPPTVTIPAGAEFVEFDVDAIDNNLLSPDTRVRLEAIHPAYLPEAMTFVVTDYEELSLTLSAPGGVEGATLIGTVTRNISNLDQAAKVLLSSLDTSEVEVPSAVIIPVGQRSISFPIQLTRDRVSDGTQVAGIKAESAGYISATAEISVTDHEFITVAMVSSLPIRESAGVVFVRITRSDINSELPLVVQVANSNSNAATVRSTFQIEPHQASVEIPVFIIDDKLVESTQTVRLSFAPQDETIDPATLELQIEDDERPWHNALNPLDVNRDGVVTPFDALLIINYLNRFGSQPTSSLPPAENNEPMFIDTSDDQNLSAIDALLVINYLNNAAVGEGESTVAPLVDVDVLLSDRRLKDKIWVSSHR